jgi:subtilisin family serine protease
VEHRAAFNIRVINLSVAAGVYESFRTDPLTLAAGRAVEAGIVVVTAAGNQGLNARGEPQYGGITAPGNAPWVLTVGAASHNGTIDRADDTIAPFSSLGPSAIDFVPKPDLVAPGVGISSLADEGSSLFAARPEGRIWGTVPTDSAPYLSLSGTSMAAPVVAGTVALMLQANPELKPAAVKAVLRASAEARPGYSPLAQGAGFLNARAAVELARGFAQDENGAARLQQLLHAFRPADAGWAPGCAPGCFEQSPGTVAGAAVPAGGTTVWEPQRAIGRGNSGDTE